MLHQLVFSNGCAPDAWTEDNLFKHVHAQKPLVVLTKYLGLTHPARPFAVSSNVVVLDCPQDF